LPAVLWGRRQQPSLGGDRAVTRYWRDVVTTRADLVIVGAGAAGLATAIFAGRRGASLRILLLDGARRPGAKILVSGGSRCNVTNRRVDERDFNGGRPAIVRRILRAFPAEETAAWFARMGVPLHEEAAGKLFPDSNRSRDVLQALLTSAAAAGVELRPDHRVLDVARGGDGFAITTSRGVIVSRAVVLATGGLSLPKSGSDGAGYEMARRLGHSLVPTTPALAPLVLDGDGPGFWTGLSGVSTSARLTVTAAGQARGSASGSLLWTHFGISGPAALDISRYWLRARLEGAGPGLTLSIAPGERFETLEAAWLSATRASPRATVTATLGQRLPAAVASALSLASGIDPATTLASCTREDRRRLLHMMVGWPLPVRDSRGYLYAEVTAGGVALPEIDPRTMESRVCPSAYLVGEMLDVDGRLGGFNFQWAWASAFVAGSAAADRLLATSV
jgi:predicted Rossmann fold flavoprotein